MHEKIVIDGEVYNYWCIMTLFKILKLISV